MPEYEKINTLWKRDQKGRIIEGEYSKEEFDMIDKWEVSEKVDGTNIRIEISPWDLEGSLVVPSFWGKTENSDIPEILNNKLESHFENIELDKIFDMSKADEVTLFCEGYGFKIQKGAKYIKDNQDFIMYDICIDGIWLESEKVIEFAKLLNMKTVPIIGIKTKTEIIDYVKSTPKSLLADCQMEGVVCRSKPLLLDRMGRRIIFKLKVRDFK
jgi:hypothetical protein